MLLCFQYSPNFGGARIPIDFTFGNQRRQHGCGKGLGAGTQMQLVIKLHRNPRVQFSFAADSLCDDAFSNNQCRNESRDFLIATNRFKFFADVDKGRLLCP